MIIFRNDATLNHSALPMLTVVACLLCHFAKIPMGIRAEEPIELLRQWTGMPVETRPSLESATFANAHLSREESEIAKEILWEDYCRRLRQARSEEIEGKFVQVGDIRMKYEAVKLNLKNADDRPQDNAADENQILNRDVSRNRSPKQEKFQSTYDSNSIGERDDRLSLFISMHGGGQTAPRVNESQWRNQIRLGQRYRPENALYVAPRAPTDTWNLWHQPHIDQLFDRLISTMIATESVDPNQVYLMGYSAGGDGVYQLAPRMADRFAAAAMMAGHPNDADPRSLRNLPFTLHVGEKDTPFRRNEVAAQWGEKLNQLHREDPQGYRHWVEIHEGKGHWMELQDQSAIPWMQQYRRDLFPDKIVWRQAGVKHDRFYWLAVDANAASPGDEIVATRKGQQILIERPVGEAKIEILLDDRFIDLTQPIEISLDGHVAFQGTVNRTIKTIAATLEQRGDPEGMFSASVNLE